MKRKLFNPGLYLDSLRRTALSGGLLSTILCIQSFIIIFGYKISSSYVYVTDVAYGTESAPIETLGMLDINPFILAVPILMVPILMMTLFGFLNKRSTSDFWHSTPFTRPCIFITFTLAALSWAVAAMILSTGVSVLGFLMMPKLFDINFASVFSVMLSVFVMSLLVAAAFTISMSVTGTALNNLIVAMLILFLPRVIMIYYGAVTSNNTLFSNFSNDGFAAGDLNLVFGLCGGALFTNSDMVEMFSSFKSIGYTFGLAIIYFAVGLILFCKRKSESAAYSSVNRYLQTAFRIIVSFIVCLVPIFIILDAWNSDGYALHTEEKFICFVLYVVAVLAYFIYEIITTKKAKNMLKAIPSLGILAVINVAFILLAHNTYNIEYNYTPTPETVTSVRINNISYSVRENYFEKLTSKTDIKDDELKRLLCDLYSDTRTRYENDTLWNNFTSEEITVGFKSGSKYRYRNLYITNEDYNKIAELIEKNEQIKEIYDIEKMFEKSVNYDYSVLASFYKESDDLKEQIKNAYIKDIKELGFEKWYQIASKPYDDTLAEGDKVIHYYNIGNLHLNINHQGSTYLVNLPISNLQPNTYDILIKAIFDFQTEENQKQELFDSLNKNEMWEQKNFPNITLYNGKTKTPREYYTIENSYVMQKVFDILEPCYKETADHDSRIAVISLGYYDSDDGWSHIEVYFKVPDDADLTFLLGDNHLFGDTAVDDGEKQDSSSQSDSTSSAQ